MRCVLDAKAVLGEGPVWAAEEQALYWADIIGAVLHRLDPRTSETRSWTLPQSIGSFGPARGGGAVLALATLSSFDLESGE